MLGIRVVSALLFLVSGLAHAQPREWFTGILALKSDEVLSGEVFIDQLHDVAFFRENERVTIYPAFRIQYARYFDKESDADKEFVSISVGRNARGPAELYELVLSGRMSVLRKNYATSVNLHETRTEYQYFVLFDGEIIPIHKFKSRVYKGTIDASGELERFVREAGLDIRYSEDVIAAARFFNGEHHEDVFSKQSVNSNY